MKNINIDYKAISMNTVNSKRIYLTYNGNTDELHLEAAIAVLENREKNGETPLDILDCSRMIKELKVYVIPHVSRIRPLIGLQLDITTIDGHYIKKKFRLDCPTDQITAIINRFFDNGATGLKSNCYDCFKQQHIDYCRKCAA